MLHHPSRSTVSDFFSLLGTEPLLADNFKSSFGLRERAHPDSSRYQSTLMQCHGLSSSRRRRGGAEEGRERLYALHRPRQSRWEATVHQEGSAGCSF